MQRFFLSSSGGDARVESILFDDTMRLRGQGVSGSMNENFVEAELCERHFEESIAPMLRAQAYPQLERLYIAGPTGLPRYDACARRLVHVKQSKLQNECQAWLSEGRFAESGIVVISSIGSSVIHQAADGRVSTIGGWGMLIDDEGSAFSIGRAGVRAAIHAREQRGCPTELTGRLIALDPERRIAGYIKTLYAAVDQRSVIASFALEVIQAAQQGDLVAREILMNAGRQMAEQVQALRTRFHIAERVVLLAGGVWRHNPCMLEGFKAAMYASGDCSDCLLPVFRPVMSGVIQTYVALYGELTEGALGFLREEYSDYLFDSESDDWLYRRKLAVEAN